MPETTSDIDQQIERYRRLLERDPDSRVFAPLAEACRKANRVDEALEIAQAGVARHPTYASGRVALARAQLALERYEDAARELAEALVHAPENALAHRLLGEARTRLGNETGAFEAFARALALNPEDAEAREALARLEARSATAAPEPAAPEADEAPEAAAALDDGSEFVHPEGPPPGAEPGEPAGLADEAADEFGWEPGPEPEPEQETRQEPDRETEAELALDLEPVGQAEAPEEMAPPQSLWEEDAEPVAVTLPEEPVEDGTNPDAMADPAGEPPVVDLGVVEDLGLAEDLATAEEPGALDPLPGHEAASEAWRAPAPSSAQAFPGSAQEETHVLESPGEAEAPFAAEIGEPDGYFESEHPAAQAGLDEEASLGLLEEATPGIEAEAPDAGGSFPETDTDASPEISLEMSPELSPDASPEVRLEASPEAGPGLDPAPSEEADPGSISEAALDPLRRRLDALDIAASSLAPEAREIIPQEEDAPAPPPEGAPLPPTSVPEPDPVPRDETLPLDRRVEELADQYLRLGFSDRARALYRSLLAGNPMNLDAQRKLREMGTEEREAARSHASGDQAVRRKVEENIDVLNRWLANIRKGATR